MISLFLNKKKKKKLMSHYLESIWFSFVFEHFEKLAFIGVFCNCSLKGAMKKRVKSQWCGQMCVYKTLSCFFFFFFFFFLPKNKTIQVL